MLFFVPSEVMASTILDPYDLPVTDKKMQYEIASSMDSFMLTIMGIIENYGFHEISHHQSPMSDSMYFLFCKESDHQKQYVKLAFYLRVSDHDLPIRSKDKADTKKKPKQAAIDRMVERVKRDELSKYEYAADDPYLIPEFVRYEGKLYNYYTLILDDVNNKMKKLVKKYMSENK